VNALRLRKHLIADAVPPGWPHGVTLQPFEKVDPKAVHALLTEAYRGNDFGSVEPFPTWYEGLLNDSEYDPALVLVACTSPASPVGVAQGWSSGFIKDLAVSTNWRGRGIGKALLGALFARFASRGLEQVDLKVRPGNTAALSLYRAVGMVEV
jgi:ribosomal protein S18 acetylase RimI-like enzyme